jgi:copper chaperone CopZ
VKAVKLKFVVTGMTCAACSARVEKVTGSVPGVSSVEVNLLKGTMLLEAENETAADAVISQ